MPYTLLAAVPSAPPAALSPLPSDIPETDGTVQAFPGLDLREKAAAGSYAACENLSTRNYPCLSPRLNRGEPIYQEIDDLYCFDGSAVYRSGTRLWYEPAGGAAVCVGEVTDTEKAFAVLNTKLTIWPDALCLDLVTGKLSPLALDLTVTGAAITGSAVLSGVFPGADILETPPISSTADVRLVIPYYDEDDAARAADDTEQRFYTGRNDNALASYTELIGKYIVPAWSADTGYALRYGHLASHRLPIPERNPNGVHGMITDVERTHEGNYTFYALTAELYLNGSSAHTDVRAGDVVFLSGLLDADGNAADEIALRVWHAAPTSLTFGENALAGYEIPTSGTVTVRRKVPALAHVCASGNRLWGVSNAVENTVLDEDGTPVPFSGRAVFCSKTGDPANWYSYQAISTDSWTAAVAGEGDFTGICAWSGEILCFKANELFRVTGSLPSSFSLRAYSVPGVESGSGGSIAVIDETVCYKSARGVYRYSGGTPVCISEPLCDALTGQGSAGTDGRNYFLSVPGGLYVYDTAHGAWTRHDDTTGRFVPHSGSLLLLDTAARTAAPMDAAPADGISWSAALHPDYGTKQLTAYATALNMAPKYYRAVELRGTLLRHSESASAPTVSVYARTGERPEECLGTREGEGSFVLRLPLTNCREDRIALRLAGTGDCILRELRFRYAAGA